MFINKVKIIGFKSFSEETILSFNDHLNGIIGPNGSGKSNIVEAIKWVMGENSSKSLRGSGMNDIIFSGSSTKASKNLASVTLFMKVNSTNVSTSTKKYLKSDYLEVERQIIRDAGSTYRINGKETKAKDVQFLFADLSSGSRASNIIDQGTIGNLITQKPYERRKILDEAAGISGISARKVESKNKLEATKRNLARLADILIDNKNNLSKLKKQAETAIKFKQASDAINKLNKDIAFAKLQKAILKSKSIKEKLKDSSRKHSEKQYELNQIEIEKNKNTDVLEKLKNSNREIHQDNINKFNQIKQVNIEIENNIKQLASIKNLKDQIKKNENFQKDILENSISRMKVLENEFSKNKKEKKIEDFRITEKKFNKLKDEFLELNNKIEENALKLLNKKEQVSNKEYEKSMLIKKKEELNFQCRQIKDLIFKKEKINKNNSNSILLDKKKFKLIKQNEETTLQVTQVKKQLKEYEDLANITKIEIDKIVSQQDQQNEKIDNIKNQITIYSSLGLNNTQKSVVKNINIESNYDLAFLLALGDGIEASKDLSAPVVWKNNILKEEINPLPKGITSINEFVKGPKEIQSFLSQVGIVGNHSDGNKYHSELKPGQILVSKDGALWRWDGLHIKDGKQTITHKRIVSTTKLIELEKTLKAESLKIEKILDIKKLIEDKFNNIKIEIIKYEKKLDVLEKFFAENNQKLLELEQSILINKREKEIEIEEINKEKNILKDKMHEKNRIKDEINSIETFVARESGEIVSIKKLTSSKNKENNMLKDKYENFRIQFEIFKKQKNEETVKNEKIEEEIIVTKKQINSTKNVLISLGNDLKKANYEESILLKNPDHNKKKIDDLNKKILSNNKSLEETKVLIRKIESKLELIIQKNQSYKAKLDFTKEEIIRKEAQLEQLDNLIIAEEDRIVNDLRISKKDLNNSLAKIDFSNIDIKSSEITLRNLKLKVTDVNDINLSAEKELKELENKINDILREERDLNNAAKKLEKAIGQLNKEARNRVINTFSKINETFSSLFKKLFDGGKAYLELIDSEDPLEAGLELLVSPPGKKLQRLTLLSGGEKALASIALIFSTFVNKQTPICILDEVDAPLDDFNVERFCNLLKETTKIANKRFIVITHNRVTMGYMDKIYGVTMSEPGISKLISVNLDKIDSEFAAE